MILAQKDEPTLDYADTGLREKMNRHRFDYCRCRLEFCYHLVRAWQWDTEAILAGGMGLLPLAPLSARELDQIPIIVERLKERVDPAAVTAEISELWTSAAVMARVGFPWELIKHCFGGITAMEESSTIQAFIEEGPRKGPEEGKAGASIAKGPR